MSGKVLVIDGSFGEGGGQILRSALALSMITGRPFRIENIRAGRSKPGLMRQHLTAVQAAAKVCTAAVTGDTIGSGTLTFEPGSVSPDDYCFAVGTAGSTTLVLQTILPALMIASAPSKIRLQGGTHNPYSPPFDFLQQTLLPLLNRMGLRVTAELKRPGFYPAGGGEVEVAIYPSATLKPLELLERGTIRRKSARALVARLPRSVAERELRVVGDLLGWPQEVLTVCEVCDSSGPGNVLCVEIESEHVTEVFTGFGQIHVRAEAVAQQVVDEVRRYLVANVPVGEHLADQLLVPLVLGGGHFRTSAPSRHTETNIELIRQFLNVDIAVTRLEDKVWDIAIKKAI